MGPGTAIKAVAGKYFSLMVFGFAQVAMDIEPLFHIYRGDSVLHGYTHTYVGAVVIGIFSLVFGKLFFEWLLHLWNFLVKPKLLRGLRISPKISWASATLGAFMGTFSHVFLDSIMHSDMHPLSPFSPSNNLLHWIPVGWLHLLCILLGVTGIMVIVLVSAWNKWAIEMD